MNKVYGKRISDALFLKKLTQKQLAIKLANNEKNLNQSDKDIEDLISKYSNLVNRWVKFKAEPKLKNIQAIGDVLNINDSYLMGKLEHPLLKYFDGEEKIFLDNIRKEGYLFKFIEEYLNYDIDYLIEDKEKNLYPIFNKILDFTKCVLTKYLDDIGVNKKSEY